MHRRAVGRAAHACAIELVRVRAARDARDEVEEELLDVLTAGGPGSQEAAGGRGARQRSARRGSVTWPPCGPARWCVSGARQPWRWSALRAGAPLTPKFLSSS